MRQRIGPLSRLLRRDDRAVGQGQRIVVMRRAMVDDLDPAILGPMLDIAPEEVIDMRLATRRKGQTAHRLEHRRQVNRPVHQTRAVTGADLRQPGRPEPGKGGMGGIDILDALHGLTLGRAAQCCKRDVAALTPSSSSDLWTCAGPPVGWPISLPETPCAPFASPSPSPPCPAPRRKPPRDVRAMRCWCSTARAQWTRWAMTRPRRPESSMPAARCARRCPKLPPIAGSAC